MSKLILALTIALFAALFNFVQPVVAAPGAPPKKEHQEPRTTATCTISYGGESCHMKLRVDIDVFVSLRTSLPVTFYFGPELGAVSMVFNGSYRSVDGWTASNTLNSDGSVTARVVWP